MGDKSAIEWTDATWNPVVGCAPPLDATGHAREGCRHCYAATVHNRRYLAWKGGTWPDAPKQYHEPFKTVQLLPERLDQPLRWRSPRRIFVNSLSDLFHDDVPDEFIAAVFGVMAACPQHTFQVLTKRPERMRAWFAPLGGHVPSRLLSMFAGFAETWGPKPADPHRALESVRVGLNAPGWPLPNVWLGVSVEDQAAADAMIPPLLATPAAVRFLSCEPLLGPLDLSRYVHCCPSCGSPRPDRAGDSCGYCENYPDARHVDWVIVGGESGPGARPMHPRWARDLIDQCQAARVATFFKQWGEYAPLEADLGAETRDAAYHPFQTREGFEDVVVYRVGKKTAGRVIDGRTWDEMPTAAAAVPA